MISCLTSALFQILVLSLCLKSNSVNCQKLTAAKTEEFTLEGGSVTLSCSYTKGSVDVLFWYRQYPGKPPEFLKSHSPFGDAEYLGRMTFEGNKEEMNMTISSAAMADSAVYYCAASSHIHLIFFPLSEYIEY
uniref:Ig-like domain-containing protein n=1 Tax=Cyprinodon variegatus TaxID=28743 RepID=A0A3Q2D9R2_CYPVA